MQSDPADLSALDALALMERGDLSAAAYAEALLARIASREPAIGAFAHLDPGFVRRQAAEVDRRRAAGEAAGPLGGLPVGIKDIVDTAELPTENGTPLDAGRQPAEDAIIVSRLKSAGATIMGKTVTTELGARHPRGTRNPHNTAHTPGGSSSGSAAAVAAGMVPLAIGTQTNGSVIRPASFCGIVGFKPSYGLIPRTGVLPQAPPLDTIGVFARTVADAALIADALAGFDASDPGSRSGPTPRLLETVLAGPPSPPRLAFVRTPAWGAATAETQRAFEALATQLGDACREAALPAVFDEGAAALKTITEAGVAHSYRRYRDRGSDRLSDSMQATIAAGSAIPAVAYLDALEVQRAARAALSTFFEAFDAILTPAAPGEAPEGLGSTGNSAFNDLWSLCGVPAITLPLLSGPSGLPVGVQLVGRFGDDARLLRTARWLEARGASA